MSEFLLHGKRRWEDIGRKPEEKENVGEGGGVCMDPRK